MVAVVEILLFAELGERFHFGFARILLVVGYAKRVQNGQDPQQQRDAKHCQNGTTTAFSTVGVSSLGIARVEPCVGLKESRGTGHRETAVRNLWAPIVGQASIGVRHRQTLSDFLGVRSARIQSLESTFPNVHRIRAGALTSAAAAAAARARRAPLRARRCRIVIRRIIDRPRPYRTLRDLTPHLFHGFTVGLRSVIRARPADDVGELRREVRHHAQTKRRDERRQSHQRPSRATTLSLDDFIRHVHRRRLVRALDVRHVARITESSIV